MEGLRSELPPIERWFIVREIPNGEPPLHIREAWQGVALPVREEPPRKDPDTYSGILTNKDIKPDDPVHVYTQDAIEALRWAKQVEAANWWQAFLEEGHVNQEITFEEAEGEFFSNTDASVLVRYAKYFDM